MGNPGLLPDCVIHLQVAATDLKATRNAQHGHGRTTSHGSRFGPSTCAHCPPPRTTAVQPCRERPTSKTAEKSIPMSHPRSLPRAAHSPRSASSDRCRLVTRACRGQRPAARMQGWHGSAAQSTPRSRLAATHELHSAVHSDDPSGATQQSASCSGKRKAASWAPDLRTLGAVFGRRSSSHAWPVFTQIVNDRPCRAITAADMVCHTTV